MDNLCTFPHSLFPIRHSQTISAQLMDSIRYQPRAGPGKHPELALNSGLQHPNPTEPNSISLPQPTTYLRNLFDSIRPTQLPSRILLSSSLQMRNPRRRLCGMV